MDYFKSLLGDEPVVTNLEENIETVFESLDIPDGPFTMEEYQQVKRKISNGKAAGPRKCSNLQTLMTSY